MRQIVRNEQRALKILLKCGNKIYILAQQSEKQVTSTRKRQKVGVLRVREIM